MLRLFLIDGGNMATDEVRERLDRVSVASVADALGRLHGHRAHILGLVSPTPGRTIFGPAVTITYFPVRSDLRDEAVHNFARLFYEAIGDDSQGKVLVMASNGHPETSMGGGTKLSRLEHHGLAGLLCDGSLRDFNELARYRFTVFCRGETPQWGGDVLMPFQANVPVVLDGVTVVPGDYVLAADNCAVVIPAGNVEGVLAEAEKIEDGDARSIEEIRDEDPAEVLGRGSVER